MRTNQYPTFVYWLFPELERFDTIEQAGKACRRAMFGSGYYVCLIVAILGVWIAPLDKYFLVMSEIVDWISISLIGAIPLGITLLFRRRVRQHLRRELVKSGVPICIKCSYDLRGQVEPRCPECGNTFDANLVNPGTRPDEPRS